MSIGTGIVLFVIGAILAFAVNVQVEWANLDMIGYILMAAGAVVLRRRMTACCHEPRGRRSRPSSQRSRSA